MPWLWLSVSEVSGKRRVGEETAQAARRSSRCRLGRRRSVNRGGGGGSGGGGGGEYSVVTSTCSTPTAATTFVYTRITDH